MITMTQHAVGQGGFFSGVIEWGKEKFRYVYDCGSNKLSRVREEIDKVFQEGDRIDILFLSHFDYDHVNGVQYLLSRCNISTVIIPYLSEDEKYAFMLRNAAWGRVEDSISTIRMIENPEEWFGGRVDRIISVSHGSDDESGSPPEGSSSTGNGRSPKHSDFSGERTFEPIWHLKWHIAPPLKTQGLEEKNGACVIKPNTILYIRIAEIYFWALIPYVHQPCSICFGNFINKIRKDIDNLDANNIIKNLRYTKFRNKIKRCYGELWPDHNLTSMSLYSGPSDFKMCFSLSGHSIFNYTRSGAFLLTGDANFSNSAGNQGGNCATCNAGMSNDRRRMKFLNHYRDFRNLVGVLMLPHHGSDKNFDISLLMPFKNLTTCYAAVGNNGYGHPGTNVRKSIYCHFKKSFQIVGDSPKSELKMTRVYPDDARRDLKNI